MKLNRSEYRLSNWIVVPDSHKPSSLEGKMLEIRLNVDHVNFNADIWITVITGFNPRCNTTAYDAASYVLCHKNQMIKIGFKLFGPASAGKVEGNDKLSVTFVCSGQALKQRDEPSVFRLLHRVCDALDVRVPDTLDVKHHYDLLDR